MLTSHSFGYVEFDKVEDAQTAINNLDMQVFEGRNLVVQFHRAKENTQRRDGTMNNSGFTPNPPL